jgi:hypothetical protein
MAHGGVCPCDVPPVHGWFTVIDRSFSRPVRSAPVNVGALWLALRVTKGFFSPFHKLYGLTRCVHILTLDYSFANSWNMQPYRHWIRGPPGGHCVLDCDANLMGKGKFGRWENNVKTTLKRQFGRVWTLLSGSGWSPEVAAGHLDRIYRGYLAGLATISFSRRNLLHGVG